RAARLDGDAPRSGQRRSAGLLAELAFGRRDGGTVPAALTSLYDARALRRGRLTHLHSEISSDVRSGAFFFPITLPNEPLGHSERLRSEVFSDPLRIAEKSFPFWSDNFLAPSGG